MDSQTGEQETKDSVGAADAENSGPSPKFRDRVSKARIELIKRVGDVPLKAALDRLQTEISGRSAVISDEERETVLAERVPQDKVRCLLKMLLNKGEEACERFLEVLAEVDRALCEELFDPVNSATTKPTQEAADTIIADYKESTQSSYKEVKEYNSLPGGALLLSDRYTELLMVECQRKPGEREEEMRARGEHHQEVLKSVANHKITIKELFRPDDRGSVPKAAILQGNSGYGKSFTAQKIMLDWASGSLYKDSFDLVLHLKCKQINEISEECSLVDLLKYSPDFTSDTAEVLRDPNVKVLVLVDGFDELKFSLEDDKSPPTKDPFKKAPVQATLKALLKGHILRKCKLLLFTRSTATDKLSRLVTDSHRFVDILGFNEESVNKYFHRFFCDKHVEDKVFDCVKNNETLYTACFIPVICWVTCTVFREEVQEGARIPAELETATSIFAHFVSILLEHHSRDSSLSVPDLLSSLGQLAEKGMQEQRVLFSEKDVLSVVSDPDKVPFLCKFLVQKKVKQEEMFSFMHLSFQEFFTALHYTLDKDGEKLKELLYSYSQSYWQSHRRPVIQFLFGLANTELIENLGDLQLTPYTSSIRRHLEEWVMKEIQHLKNKGVKVGPFFRESRDRDIRALFILHCLYEFHVEEFVREAMDAFGPLSFTYTSLTRMDCWVLRYCLLCCSTFKALEFDMCYLTDEMLKMLQPALSRCEELTLQDCGLTDISCSSLAAALRSNSSSLRHLDLSENYDLGDSGVKLLSTGLEHPNCRLETLKLQECGLTDISCSSLAAALRSNSSSLRHLDLSANRTLGDSGVKLLSTGLEHPNCKLETLTLRECGLTDIICSSLAAALRSNSSSLRHLDLSRNRTLGDSGVKLLSTGLEHPNCRLETLKLVFCSITALGCAAMASALKSNPSSHLTHLDLGVNLLGASAVQQLSALVKDPNYKLQTVTWERLNFIMTQMNPDDDSDDPDDDPDDDSE